MHQTSQENSIFLRRPSRLPSYLMGHPVLQLLGDGHPDAQDLGWSAGTVTSAFALAFLISGISAILVGRWVDRYGSRVVMTIGSCLGACCCCSGHASPLP